MVTTARAVVSLSLWLSVCQISGSFIPQEMNKTIQKLSQNYKADRRDMYNGETVFAREPLTDKTQSLPWKKVFVFSILETYEKLFGHMLKQLPTPCPQTAENKAGEGGKDREGLNKLLGHIRDLEHRYGKEEKLLQELQSHRHIQLDQMTNATVQRKALQELPWLYFEASKLVDSQQSRRRRHTRRFKKHPRV